MSIIALCSTAVATGCMLDRRAIASWGAITPTQYCPGDMLRASYDFLGSETCSTDPAVRCADYFPTVTLNSTPMVFPTQTLPPGYRGSFDFAAPATGDAVTVAFHSSNNPVTIPTDRFDGGSRVFVQRTNVTDVNIAARRITDMRSMAFTHTGMCEGASHAYAPGDLTASPLLSPNMRLVNLCNNNGVHVIVTFSGGAAMPYSTMLTPGECLDIARPDIPAGTDASRIIEVRPLSPDPAARCSATGPNTPPMTLRTTAALACR
ncbi:MAG: hypothetical protein E6Q88_10535 [Lysobacteraceae bacterium]|nr:MAG: hypothetical protein E6Q88_10535 [Xanthomonadaceae bacterium]